MPSTPSPPPATTTPFRIPTPPPGYSRDWPPTPCRRKTWKGPGRGTFTLLSSSLASPKTALTPPSSAVERNSSWCVEEQLNCTAADDQLGGDLDLQGFFEEGLISVSSPLTLVEKRDKCCSPLGVIPMFLVLLWCSFFSLP